MTKLIRAMAKRAVLVASACGALLLAGATQAEETKDAQADGPKALSAGELKAHADAVVANLVAAEQRVAQKLSAAREEKDVVKTLCLDDKHKQVDTALRTAKDRKASLNEALTNGSTEKANHEHTLLGVLQERVTELVSQSDQCIGQEESSFTSDEQSELSMSVDEILPSSDSNLILLAPVIAVSPSVSSPVD